MKKTLALFSFIMCFCSSNFQSYESIEKDEFFRQEILKSNKGQYVKLSIGFTYYEEANPNSDKGSIVLVHGFSVPSYIWQVTFNSLKENGYHVVMLDLYGRGNSENPNLPQTDQLRAQQVLDLMNKIDLKKAVLVGLSNGGRIISKIADLNYNKIEALFYVSSSSFQDHQKQDLTIVSQSEIDAFIQTYPTRSIDQLEDFYIPENFPEWPKKYEKLLFHKGFAKALISTQKNLVKLDKIHQKIDSLNIPVYAFWGKHDKVVQYSNFEMKLNKLLPNRKEYFIEESAHLPHMENRKLFENYFFASLNEVLN